MPVENEDVDAPEQCCCCLMIVDSENAFRWESSPYRFTCGNCINFYLLGNKDHDGE
jgi:hypothetical protein